MSEFDARKFRFVSPGIFLNEIDQSQIPALPENEGPVIIGRAERGPGMTPVRVNSFSEFVEKFGHPISGFGGQGDIWRDGNYSSPTYGGYAAQAYLRAGVGPITFIRLMGTQSPDAVAAGYAGWDTSGSVTDSQSTNGGAYGLYVFPSASAASAAGTGTLAAVWYLDSGAMRLSGTIAGGTSTTASAGTVIASDSNGNFKAEILGRAGTATSASFQFSLNESDPNFVREVFNTNPQAISTVTSTTNRKSYWLGETFEGQVGRLTGINDSTAYGVIMAVATGSSEHGNQRIAYRDSHSGWFFAQSLNADSSSYVYEEQQKLFKFVGINGHGSWLQNNVKISITNIKASSNENVPHGTFDVVLRRANDSDLRPVILERFSNCNLNPNSVDYIARKIGDAKVFWDDVEQRYRELGDYPNISEYVRVVMHEDVVDGINASLLPFGVFGPPRYTGFDITSGSGPSTSTFALASNDIPFSSAIASELVHCTAEFATGSIVFPSVLTRVSCSNGADGADPTTNAYFGLQTNKSLTSAVHDPGYADYIRTLSSDKISDATWGDTFGQNGYGTGLEPQFRFSLDEVVITTGSNAYDTDTPTQNITDAAYISGSHAAGTSLNSSASVSFERVLNAKINRFTSPLFGGSDGVDITERNPFGNHKLTGSPTEATNYVFYTLRRAVRTIADPEVVSMNAASIPGILNSEITKYLIDTCETRADALAVIDVADGFTPREESSSAAADRRGILSTVLSTHKARNLNSSYGAAYYPWVKVRDDQTGNIVTMPPSVVALGVLANTERAADVWFAPAGFNRGGLSQGAGGLTVVGVEQKLTSRNRDDLYDVNINPIASFPAEGIVVFGQKTLQATPSALDRINVRRLMIFVKRGISRIASATLFQPNVSATWNDFKSRADAFLSGVKVRFGVDDFRVILDETTTTADLVDRNIMYAKIFIKPTRAIEFIAIDFVITRSGASFED
jgi:phage tail sheath protein FI